MFVGYLSRNIDIRALANARSGGLNADFPPLAVAALTLRVVFAIVESRDAHPICTMDV
jgi:hypothetical protein